MKETLEDRLRTLELEVAQTYLAEREQVVERQRELVSQLEHEVGEARTKLFESEQRLTMQIATRDRIAAELHGVDLHGADKRRG